MDSPRGRSVSLCCSEDGVYIIRLNRPETKNAFNQQLYDEICLSLMAAEEDDRVVMVRFFPAVLRTSAAAYRPAPSPQAMITGSGNFFSSGADLKGGNVDPLTGETYERADGTPVYMEYLPRAPIARSVAALSLRADR